jgi:hypothetical protein
MRCYNTGCDVKKRHSQSEIECYPNLPSKLIRDEIDWITKTRAARSSQRSAVKPSGRENVAKKSGGGGGSKDLNHGLHERSKISALRRGQKRSMQGPYSGASNMSKEMHKVWFLFR